MRLEKEIIMNKKLVAGILCVVFPILIIFSGCSSQQLSEDEYIEAVASNFKDYSGTISTLFSVLEYGVNSFEEIDADEFEQEYQKAATALDNLAALNPPEEYSDLDSKLESGVSQELAYIECLNEYYSHIKNYPDLSDDDLSEMERILEECENIVSGDSVLADSVLEIMAYYNNKS